MGASCFYFGVPLLAQGQSRASIDDERIPLFGRDSKGKEELPKAEEPPRFPQVFVSLGGGVTLRLIYDEPELYQDKMAPPYVQLRGAYFFRGAGSFQHGLGLGVATNLLPDPPNTSIAAGFNEFGQWTLAPSYFARLWLSEEAQVFGAVGVPLALSLLYQVAGLELSVGLIYKFLNGMGLYLATVPSLYFGLFVQPLVSVDAGLLIDYEIFD
ncbi:MAG: hypothetical protein RMJ84_11035 [Sandaracinaceae bacterium]|nr:hypothetical protein [Sandaracinaceae bacterium]